MERAYGITKDIFSKKCISKNAYIRHYSTVVKPECLYASERLALNYNLDKLEILERRIIRKILGPRKSSEGWKLRSNDEIYQSIENVTETMRKRRLLFFVQLYRMDDNRLTKPVSYTHLDVYKRQVHITSVNRDSTVFKN